MEAWFVPPNAPDRVVLHIITAIRIARALGPYQKLKWKMIPGKTPASATPRRNRSAMIVEVFFAPPIPAHSEPNTITRIPIHLQVLASEIIVPEK